MSTRLEPYRGLLAGVAPANEGKVRNNEREKARRPSKNQAQCLSSTEALQFDRADIREGNSPCSRCVDSRTPLRIRTLGVSSPDRVIPDGRKVEGDSRSVGQRDPHLGRPLVSNEFCWTDRRGAPAMTAGEVHCKEQGGNQTPTPSVALAHAIPLEVRGSSGQRTWNNTQPYPGTANHAYLRHPVAPGGPLQPQLYRDSARNLQLRAAS